MWLSSGFAGAVPATQASGETCGGAQCLKPQASDFSADDAWLESRLGLVYHNSRFCGLLQLLHTLSRIVLQIRPRQLLSISVPCIVRWQPTTRCSESEFLSADIARSHVQCDSNNDQQVFYYKRGFSIKTMTVSCEVRIQNLGELWKLRKATISFAFFVCPWGKAQHPLDAIFTNFDFRVFFKYLSRKLKFH